MNRLSSDVVSALRTDVTITSTPQCITELVLNSIDAKATSIAVRVDLNLFKVHVIDNGCGISENDLRVLGNRYMTSKCHSMDDLRTNLSSFGFRGEALASLCEVAGTVMITSRPAGSNNTYCKMITQGRHQKVVLSSRPRSAPGTTLLVADFLYNRPVRRNRISAAFDLEEIKIHLERIALIHPQVSFSLRDDGSGQIILETKKSSSIVGTFSSLYGAAIADTLCAVKERSKPFEVSGYISKEPFANKSLQFIYINKRLLIKSKLHKLVNSIMGRSSILKVNNVPHNPISKEINSAFFLAMSPPKRSKHAVYILNITCPYSEYDITLDPKKTLIEFRNWDTILNCIETLLRNFLEPHVTPDSPGRQSSLFDEIDRLAREDAAAKGGHLDTNLGIRTILSLPARRDTVIYTPPSQYTVESTVISSERALESTIVSSDSEDLVRRTSFSEDPCPPQYRGKAAPTISSEDPFRTTRTSHTTNHEFDTTSQEDSSTVSTKDFLTVFKQPVLHKKLKHRNPQTKLPVGGPLHFELNLRRVTNMLLPVEIKNKSLQRFAMDKSAQQSAASDDTANYRTPVNAAVRSEESPESLADLPYSTDLVARLGSPDADATPSATLTTIVPVESYGIALQENHVTMTEGDLVNERSDEKGNFQRSTECDRVSPIDETDLSVYVTEGQPQTSEEVIPNSQQEVQHPFEVGKQVNLPPAEKFTRCVRVSSIDETDLSVYVTEGQQQTSEEVIPNSQQEVQHPFEVGNLPPTEEFLSSEDFLITREDICKNSRKPSPGFHYSTSVAPLLENMYFKDSNTLDNTNSCVMTEHSSLVTESGGVCCVQPEPCSDYVEKILPNQCSEDLSTLNDGRSSAESEESLNGSSERTSISNMTADSNKPILICQFELISEADHSHSSAFSSLEENRVKDNNVACARKRNAEKYTTANPDEPLNKIVTLEDNYFRNSAYSAVHCSITTQENDANLRKNMASVEDGTPESLACSGDSRFSSKTNRLKRHSVVLNCSIDSLVAVLSPKLNQVSKDSRSSDARSKSKTRTLNEQLKPFLERNSCVLTDSEIKIAGFSREKTEMSTTNATEEVPAELADNGSSAVYQSSDKDFRICSSGDESLIEVFNRTLLEKQDSASKLVSIEFETKEHSLPQSRNTDADFGISSSRDESLIAVYDKTMLEKRDSTLQVVGMDVERTEEDVTQSRNTDEDVGMSSSRDESLIAVYNRTLLQDSASESVIIDFETKGHSLPLSRNTDEEFGISSSRDESLIAAYDKTMRGKCDDTLQSVSMDVERTEADLTQSRNSDEETKISSSRDESLIAVYDKTMLELDHRAMTWREADCVLACSQEEVANVVDESSDKAGNLTDQSDDLSDHWEEHTDHMGRKYFIHALKGTIRFDHVLKEGFEMEDRCRFLPKGLSPLVGSTMMSSLASHGINTKTNESNLPSGTHRFENLAGLETVKWLNRKSESVFEKSWPLLDQILSTLETERETSVASAMIQDQPNAQVKVYNICYPYTFTKDIFNNLKVIGQLDRKFIVTIAKLSSPSEQSDVVVLFDQHAVHERIRVERLTKEYREEGAGIVWRSAPVHPALPLSLSAREVRLMTNCTSKLESLGLRFSSNDSHSVRITGVPTCLLLREDREVHGRGASVLKSHLESLIREEVDALVQTRGVGVEQPAIIRNVIASEACRGAVKFGHILETEECRAFLHNLSSCEVPFQCAHGRPALTPIADLCHLRRHTKTRKPNLWKLRRT